MRSSAGKKIKAESRLVQSGHVPIALKMVADRVAATLDDEQSENYASLDFCEPIAQRAWELFAELGIDAPVVAEGSHHLNEVKFLGKTYAVDFWERVYDEHGEPVPDEEGRVGYLCAIKMPPEIRLRPPNIGSNPEEPSEEILGYHCTSEKNVDSILKNGFESIPYMVDDGSFFEEHFYSCLRMLSVPEEKKGELEELHDRKRKKATEEMSRLWHDEYGHGAVIWISHSSPATEFGEACLSVSGLPKGSVEIASDGVYGSAYWCPVSPIPAQNFKRHPNVGSNPPASEGQVDIKGLVSARITVDPDYPAINPPEGRPEDARAKMAVALDTELKSTFGGNQIYWFGPFVIIGDGLGGILGKIEASFWPASDWVIDGVRHSHGPRLHLAFIGVEEEQRGKGNATAILSALAQIADKYGWEMDGNVDPQPDEKGKKPPMNRRQLMKFYRKFGFEPQPGIRDGIIRRPSGANPEDGIGEV
jgi:GNAT superfamily N-acetyltransferase